VDPSSTVDPSGTVQPSNSVQPITQLVAAPLLLVVDRDRRIDDLSAPIAQAKAKPRNLLLRTAPRGTIEHLVAERLVQIVPLTIDPIPRRDLHQFIEGPVDAQLDTLARLLPAVQSGIVKPLALSGTRRAPMLRDVPLLTEAGLPALDVESWMGIVTSSVVSADTLVRLHADITRALATQDLHDVLIDDGYFPVGSTPAEFGATMQRERAKVESLARTIAIKQ
jgi:tripartite-type tricarboxylate transporter receptor subunit TctC